MTLLNVLIILSLSLGLLKFRLNIVSVLNDKSVITSGESSSRLTLNLKDCLTMIDGNEGTHNDNPSDKSRLSSIREDLSTRGKTMNKSVKNQKNIDDEKRTVKQCLRSDADMDLDQLPNGKRFKETVLSMSDNELGLLFCYLESEECALGTAISSQVIQIIGEAHAESVERTKGGIPVELESLIEQISQEWLIHLMGLDVDDESTTTKDFERIVLGIRKLFDIAVTRQSGTEISEKERTMMIVYNTYSGVWMNSQRMLKQLIHFVLRQCDVWTKDREGQVRAELNLKVGSYNIDDFDQKFLSMAHGVDLNLETLAVVPQEASHLCLKSVPYAPDTDVATPVFNHYLKTTFNTDAERQYFMEIIAYTAYQIGRPVPYFFFFYSDGSSGKSVATTLVGNLVGQDNVSGQKLANLSDHFGLSVLKRVNIAGEDDSTVFSATSLKAITGGDVIAADRKNQSATNKVLDTKFIFSFNQLPFLPENTYGLARRLRLLTFPNTFTYGKQDLKLNDKLVDELPGISAKLLETLRKLRAKDYEFAADDDIDQTLEEYVFNNDPVRLFMREQITWDGVTRVDQPQFFPAFLEWCRVSQHDTYTFGDKVSFWKQMKKIDGEVVGRRFVDHTKTVHGKSVIVGFKLKPLPEGGQNNDQPISKLFLEG